MSLLAQLQISLSAGTRRVAMTDDETLRQLAPPATAALIGNIARQENRETCLWQAYAVFDLMRRAGYQPGRPEDLPHTAAPDTLLPCPEPAASLLQHILRGSFLSLLAQWLHLARQHHCRLPHELLPALLSFGVNRPALQPLIAACIDERGRWLARHSEHWRYAANAVATEDDVGVLRQLWETGTPSQRIAALLAWRQREVDAAHTALQTAWKDEPTESRVTILRALATAPSPGDESLAEAALDDKRKEVRSAAQVLLAQLPASQFMQRMRARAIPLLRVESRLLRRKALMVELPAQRSKVDSRDGIGIDKHPALGEKAGWLADSVAHVPPGFWSQSWDMTAEQALPLITASDHAHALLAGITRACALAPEACPDWYRALISLWLASDHSLRTLYPRDFFAGLKRVPPAQRDPWLLAWVEQSDAGWSDGEPVCELLMSLDTGLEAWQLPLSQAVIGRLRLSVSVLNQPYSALRQHLPNVAMRIDPRALHALESDWPKPPENELPAWVKARDEFNSIVRFRLALDQAFKGEVP